MGERLLKSIYDFKFYTENIFLVYLFTNLSLVESLQCFQKRNREETLEEEEEDPTDALKAVGEVGKGFVRNIYLLKAPRLTN